MSTAHLSISRLRSRYTRRRASERARNSSETQKCGVIKKVTLPKCSAQRNRLGAFPGPIESYDPKDGADKRSSQTKSGLARYFHLKGTKSTNNLVTRKNQIVPATILLFKRRRLSESSCNTKNQIVPATTCNPQ